MSRTLSPALQKLIASFKQALPDKFAEIQALHIAQPITDEQALQDYYTAVHRLAGSAGSYGFRPVSESARILDRYLSDVIAQEVTYDAERAAGLLADLQQVIEDAAAG